MIERQNWNPASWRCRPVSQAVDYPDPALLASIEAELRTLPPLVTPGEIRSLRDELAEVAAGRRLLLQAGDCAESFADHSLDAVTATLQAILQTSLALAFAAGKPVVNIGRIAGQYAKPRSAAFETVDGVEIGTYRGDIVNGAGPCRAERTPDPRRMLQAYARSAATANLMCRMQDAGAGDARLMLRRNLDRFAAAPGRSDFLRLLREVRRAATLAASSGVIAYHSAGAGASKTYLSHEALLLPYEEGLTSRDEETGEWYDGSAHMVWVGERTRGVDDAHIEYVRGISNPVGLKCGPGMGEDDLLALVDRIDPRNRPGRLVLIVRMGADHLAHKLPALIRRVEREGRNVIWVTDPMHGNTTVTRAGYKTRDLDAIRREAAAFFSIHDGEGTVGGGLHLELTGADVTECVGGMGRITEARLAESYRTLCDPRLNPTQALELMLLIADELAGSIERDDASPLPPPRAVPVADRPGAR